MKASISAMRIACVLPAAVLPCMFCGEMTAPVSGTAQETPTVLSVVKNGTAADRFELRITGPDMSPMGPLTYYPGDTAELYVPPGADRRFCIYGYTGTELTDSGVTVQTIVAEQHNHVAVAMAAVIIDPPTGGAVLYEGGNYLVLGWNPVPRAEWYCVHASPGFDGPYTKIAEVTDTLLFLHDEVYDGYPAMGYYKVSAKAGASESALSARLPGRCSEVTRTYYESVGRVESRYTYTYNGDGRRISRAEARFDSAGNVAYTYSPITYSYDIAGRLLAEYEDDTLLAWSYMYDAQGRLRRVSAPSRSETSYQYDLEGRVTRSDRKDEYDPAFDSYAVFSYDSCSRLVGAKWRDLATDTTKADIYFEYDSVGRLVKYQEVYPTGSWSNTYEYDTAGKLTRVGWYEFGSYDGGYLIEYDTNGRIVRRDFEKDSSYVIYQYSCIP
ncbi:MAG: hypothetical protein GF331_27345 [Chitinivibrionales bacterium]|nr:hypothetical protein [Chitinivibrionales bacterium]